MAAIQLTAAGLVAALEAAQSDPVVHHAVGIFLKHAGARDHAALLSYLDAHIDRMPRPAVRLAVEKLDPTDRRRYVG